MKKILIGSLQFSPIYKSHCCALGKQCESFGYDVRYLFSYAYEWMLSDSLKEKTIFIGNSVDIPSALFDGLNLQHIVKLNRVISTYSPDYIYMYNFHPFLNYYLAKLARKYGLRFIQHVQEPYVEDKTKFKGSKRYWLHLFESFQELLLNNVDTSVTSSERASYLFDKRYAKFRGKKVSIPLMYEDLEVDSINTVARRYITFMGPPVPSKSPETFLEIIDYAEQYNLDLEFLLITRRKVVDEEYRKKNLKIFYKDRISDEEIGYYLKRSLMTVTPYKFSTQSSSVLTSYMYGTPVLSTDVGGLPEIVDHLKTGYVLNLGSPMGEWIEGVEFIKSHIASLSANCRNYFLREFSEANWPKYFKYVFNGAPR